MANNKHTNKVIQFIVSVLLLFLMLGTVGVIYKFTNGGNEDFKTFYLTYEGEDILTANSSKALLRGREHRFDVKYTFDLASEQPRDYTVKIVPNISADFTFKVDGLEQKWRGEDDITEAFELTKGARYFSLFIPANASIETVLQTLYKGVAIEVIEDTLQGEYYFTLVVASYNEKVEYRIDFAMVDYLITLSESHIVV